MQVAEDTKTLQEATKRLLKWQKAMKEAAEEAKKEKEAGGK